MYQKKKIIPESFGILNSKFNQYSCCRLQLSLTLITCGFSSVGKNGVGKARDSQKHRGEGREADREGNIAVGHDFQQD